MNRLIHLWHRIFPLPTVMTEATEQLAEARLALLASHAQAEYWSSKVQMLKGRVERLEEIVSEA